MSRSIHVVTDYKTHRKEMRETINAALPQRSPMLGLVIGFTCAIILVCAGAVVIMPYLGS